MNHDPNILQFVSDDEIDKVVHTGTIVIANSGPFGSSYATSDRIVETTVPNPYKKKCLIRYRWSIDGVNFNSPETILSYGFTIDATAWGGPVSDPNPGVIGATALYASNEDIGFRTLNGHHGNVTYTGTAMSPGPDSFSPIAHDFTIQYALLEID